MECKDHCCVLKCLKNSIMFDNNSKTYFQSQICIKCFVINRIVECSSTFVHTIFGHDGELVLSIVALAVVFNVLEELLCL